MRLIIAGSRTVDPSPSQVRDAIAEHFEGVAVTEIVSGACRGADISGEQFADSARLPVRRFPADWTKHGKAAGKLRNREMADYADAALVFWDGMSSGAADMTTRMVARGKPVRVVPMRRGAR